MPGRSRRGGHAFRSEAAGLEAVVDTRIADCDFGAWAGRTLAELESTDPDAVQSWMLDPESAPHGGESLAVFSARIAGWLDVQACLDGRAAAVTHSDLKPRASRRSSTHGSPTATSGPGPVARSPSSRARILTPCSRGCSTPSRLRTAARAWRCSPRGLPAGWTSRHAWTVAPRRSRMPI